MAQAELWASLRSAIDPLDAKAMPVVLQSTIVLLETELNKARAALQEFQEQSKPPPTTVKQHIAAGAMATYKTQLLQRAASTSHSYLPLLPLENPEPSGMAQVSAEPDNADLPISLLDVLSNTLVLDHLAPYLPVASLLALASTSTTLRSYIMNTPYVFRYLNLSPCRGAQIPSIGPIDCGGVIWRNGRIDESLSEDEFYSGPLRGIFADLERRSILQDVRTLVLDGLSVPADLIAEIILSGRFNVSILSIRECQNLNERKLMQTLQYAVRRTRAKGTPSVKGIYYFTPQDTSVEGSGRCDTISLGSRPSSDSDQSSLCSRSTSASHQNCCCQSNALMKDSVNQETTARDTSCTGQEPTLSEWYTASGRVLKNGISSGWAQTIELCQGIISFDVVLCDSPRHNAELYVSGNRNLVPNGAFLPPAIATIALGPNGCEGCHRSPADPVVWGKSPEECFPLLSPPPSHSYRTSVAKNPAAYPDENPTIIVQCDDCLRGCWCRRCNRWWCSKCVPDPRMPMQMQQSTVSQPDQSKTRLLADKVCTFHPLNLYSSRSSMESWLTF